MTSLADRAGRQPDPPRLASPMLRRGRVGRVVPAIDAVAGLAARLTSGRVVPSPAMVLVARKTRRA